MLTLSFFRVLGCVAVLALFPRRIVPLSVRCTLILTTLLLVYPLLNSTVVSTAASLNQGNEWMTLFAVATASDELPITGSTVTWSESAADLAVGLMLGIVLSVAAFGAMALGAWSASLLVRGPIEHQEVAGVQRSYQEPLYALVMLMFVFVFIHSETVFSVYRELVRSFTTLGFSAPITGLETASFVKVVIQVSQQALIGGAVLYIPLVIAVIFVDLTFGVCDRYLETFVTPSLAVAGRYPVVVSVLSLGFYWFHGEMIELLGNTDRVTLRALELVRQP